MRKRKFNWLLFLLLLAGIVDLCLPHPRAYLADPISILISVGISAAIMAAQVGIEFLVAKKQKVPNVDRGKMDDIRISTSGYGEFIPKGWGMFRIAPIWVDGSPIVHTVVTTPGQGGGKSPKPPTAGTEDHIYTKTVIGKFHHGLIYKGVTRIWFDTDLVYNNSKLLLSTLFYDAEYGTLAGGATVATQAECSNGRKVTGLGSGGTCQIACTAPDTASYEMAVHYTSITELTFKVSVNGGATVDLVCLASGGAGVVAVQTLTVSLTAGANTITFSNAGVAAPDLDMISLAPALVVPDTRSFTGLTNPNAIGPNDQDVPWPAHGYRPILEDVGDGGVTDGAYQSTTLTKYGNPSIRIYPGSKTQPVDSAALVLRGANAPAYRGFGIIVIENLQLINGRLPNVTIEVNQGVREVATIVRDIYDLCPSAPTLNLTALNGMVLGDNTGYSDGTYSGVTWTSLVNATQTAGGAISKTSGTENTWNATAYLGSSIASGNASIRFTASQGVFMIGFSTANPPTVPNIKFAVLINLTSFPSIETKNAIQMVIDGAQSSDVGTWSAGDQFQVEIRDGRCRAYQNGVELVNFIPPVPSFPLYPVFMGYHTGGGISAASYAAGANVGSEPSVANGGGLLLSSRRSAADLLNDLQTRFQFDMVEVDGGVKAILRNNTSDITIPYSDLKAHSEGDDMPVSYATIVDLDPYMLPGRVDVNYLDPSMDYHNNTQSDLWLFEGRNDNQSVSLSVIDSAANMKNLAVTLLNKADRESRSFTFQASYKYMHVHPGTVTTLTLPNATHVVRVTQAKYPLPAGVIEFQGVRQEASIYSPSGTGSTSLGFEPPIVPIPGNTIGIILDGPLFRPEDQGDGTEPVVYVGNCGRGGGTWPGSFMFQENPTASGVYVQVTSFDKPSGIGVAVGALDNVSDYAAWDSTSTIDVNLYYDPSLSSATTGEVEDNPNLNLLAVKNPSTGTVEVVQFKTVVAGVASSPFVAKYTLSDFLRGRFNTQNNVGDHTAADEIAIIDSSIKPRRFPQSAIGQTFNFKFVTSGQHQDDAVVVPFTLMGNSLKAVAPTDLAATVDPSLNWHLRMSGESPGQYIFRVRRFSDGLLMRDIPVNADGGTSFAAVFPDYFSGDAGAFEAGRIVNNNVYGGTTGTSDHRITYARSAQEITQPGAFIEATFIDVDSTGAIFARLSLLESSFTPWQSTGAGSAGFYAIEIQRSAGLDPIATLTVLEADETGLIGSIGSTTVYLPAKIRIALVGTQVRFYVDWVNANSIPLARGTYPLRFPLKLKALVFDNTGIENIKVGGLADPQTIYSTAQQTQDNEDNGGTGPLDDITVEGWQVSPLVYPDQKGVSTPVTRFNY